MSLKTARRNAVLLISLCGLITGIECLAQTPKKAQTAVKPDQEPQQVEARVKTDQKVFDFHSGFWMNLHHFLYQQARAQKATREGDAERAARAAGEVASIEALDAEQKRIWTTVLEHYQKNWVDRDLLFDDDLVKINYRLAELENETTLKQSGLREELVVALEQAAPVYRTHWWKDHDRVNRSWIADVASLAQKHGRILGDQLATAYREPWAKGPIRAEVAIYASWAGAYTTLDPTLITISSTNAAQQGLAALEIVFHEASHAMIGAVMKEISNECKAQNKQIPRNLWHMTLFYTTGEIVKRALSKDGQKDYTPYAYKQGLYERSPDNQRYRRLLEQHWQPYLDGKSDFAQAIKQMVAGP